MPVAIVVTAITLVGLPASFMVLAVYLAAIYLAKGLGWSLPCADTSEASRATKGDWLLGLLLGLLILTIVGFIPYLGGLIHLGVVCVGSGAFA